MNGLQSLTLALLSLFIGSGTWEPVTSLDLASVELTPRWESPWLLQHLAADPEAEAIVKQYLANLGSKGFSKEAQGIYVETANYPVAKHRETQRLSAASLTKVATTLAALETWSIDHRFETLVGWRGTLANGTLQGDLIIKGGHDPMFVWEEAIALGNALQQLGVQRVTGDLIVVDRFVMNFQTDPITSGTLLKQAFNAKLWSQEVTRQYQTMLPGTPQPQIQIEGGVKVEAPYVADQASGWLIRHHSLPLAAVLKAMNIYSNNVMSDMVADTLGGPGVVMQVAEQAGGVAPGEINLINGSGLGTDNQMSARAAVSLFKTIHQKLQVHGLTIADLFPVAGADKGTLKDRSLPANAALKTGSLSVVSALAGVFPTEKKGIVWFAVINYGSGLNALRTQQDSLLSALEKRWGKATQVPDELKTTIRFNQDPFRLGDPKRNQALSP